MFSSVHSGFLAVAVWLGIGISPASLRAIAINNTATPGYITGVASFTGVTRIVYEGANGSMFMCSGALINPMYVVTAGHCVAGASNWQVAFETPGFNSLVLGVDGSFLHPNFGARPSPVDNLFEYDVAVLRLASLAPADAQIYGLHRTLDDVPANGIVDLVGYGIGGSAASGYLSAGTRRHAQTTVAGALDTLLGAATPDRPLETTLTFGAATEDWRGLINGGDSGGPMLFNSELLGIASYANTPRPGSGDYNDGILYYAGHENVADPLTGGWLAQFEIPEPSAWLLTACGLALLLFVRVGRRLRRN